MGAAPAAPAEPERAPARPPPPDPALVARGRRLFAGLAATLILAEGLLFGLQLDAGSAVAGQTCGRLGGELLLLYAMWRGQRWAGWTLAGCFALVGLAASYVIAMDVWPWTADAIIGTWALVVVAWAVVIARSEALAAYQAHQRD